MELVKDVVKNGNDSKQAIKDVGLEKHIDKFPNQLSGGEQQRVSIGENYDFSAVLSFASCLYSVLGTL